jgi:hypothetical protein
VDFGMVEPVHVVCQVGVVYGVHCTRQPLCAPSQMGVIASGDCSKVANAVPETARDTGLPRPHESSSNPSELPILPTLVESPQQKLHRCSGGRCWKRPKQEGDVGCDGLDGERWRVLLAKALDGREQGFQLVVVGPRRRAMPMVSALSGVRGAAVHC